MLRGDDRPGQWREELLRRLSPTVRPRVESNSDYEELVALLAAWLQASDEHLSAVEEKVVTRLSAQLAPGGDWKFPVQTLAIPRELKTRSIDEETRFQGSGGKDDQWRPCGQGWTRPTALASWKTVPAGRNRFALVCDIQTDRPDARVLLPEADALRSEGQQLAFVCGDDDTVEALVRAPWVIQQRGSTGWHRVSVTRYQDYLRFERGVGGSRMQQRQLSAWLPPFYPYSRKFLRFALEEPIETEPSEEWQFLGPSSGYTRIAALIDAETKRKIESARNDQNDAAQSPLILNAIPIAQMQIQTEDLLGSPFRTEDGFARPISGVWGVFAATVQQVHTSQSGSHVSYPAAGLRLGKADFNAQRQDEQAAVITCGPQEQSATEYQVRLYYGCRGEGVSSMREISVGPQVFSTPFPMLGGKNASVSAYGDAGSRHAWYQNFVRAPQPTEADIIEILRQIPSCKQYLTLLDPSRQAGGQGMIQLDIETRPQVERTQWGSYLWPTMVSEDTLLDMRASHLSASQVAITPLMRLHFTRRSDELPGFLWREMERYTASVLAQYFMVGWYKLEGVIANS